MRAIKIYVHINKDRRQDVLETYTFTIQYTASEDGICTPSGLDVSGMKHTGVTIEASNIALQQALRQIAEMCNDMPQLPRELLKSSMLACHTATLTASKQNVLCLWSCSTTLKSLVPAS